MKAPGIRNFDTFFPRIEVSFEGVDDEREENGLILEGLGYMIIPDEFLIFR